MNKRSVTLSVSWREMQLIIALLETAANDVNNDLLDRRGRAANCAAHLRAIRDELCEDTP